MIVTVEDVESYLRKKFAPDHKKGVELIVAGVQSELERLLGNRLEVVELVGEEYTVAQPSSSIGWSAGWASQELPTNSPGRRLYLRSTPVIEVSQLKINGTLLPSVDYTVRRWGIENFWPLAYIGVQVGVDPVVTVDYTAGFDAEDDPQIRLAICRGASRELRRITDDATGIDRISVEGYSAQYSPDVFTQPELDRLSKFRKLRSA